MLCYERKSLQDCILSTLKQLKSRKDANGKGMIVIANGQLYDQLLFTKSVLSYENINVMERVQVVHVELFSELVEIIRNCFNRGQDLSVLALYGVFDELLSEGTNHDSEFLPPSLYTSRSLDYVCNLLFNLQSCECCQVINFGSQDLLDGNYSIPIEETKTTTSSSTDVSVPVSLIVRKWFQQDDSSIN